MAWRDYYGYGFFPKSSPRPVKGGIKAQSKQGGFGKSWWAKRWINVLEGFDIGARLQRGRSYARSGQVVSIDIDVGLVTAAVQGSRPAPYNVQIKVKTLSKANCQALASILSKQAIFAAKLLSGQMPDDIEKAFADAGLSLFPARLNDLHTECSCPDWSNPCKHIAAVFYLLGEEFDRDPFLIFKMRGLDRDKLVSQLGEQADKPAAASASKAIESELSQQPLNPEPAAFWTGPGVPAGLLGDIRPPPVSASLAKRLGNFPFWRGTQRFMDVIEPVYSSATLRGQEVLL